MVEATRSRSGRRAAPPGQQQVSGTRVVQEEKIKTEGAGEKMEVPQRLSGGKRTSSHPETAAPDQAQQEQKKQKKTYTPHQNKDQGHYHVVLGEDIVGTPDPNRWKILDLIGEGTFAKVVEAWDRKRRVYVAVKIVRAVEKYVRDAKFEINILHKIKEDDARDFYPTVKYRSYFFAKPDGTEKGQHMCIVFPKLGFSLLDYLNRCSTFKLQEVAHIGWQLGAALNYMHAHLRLIHTDLKPENILLEKPCEQIDRLGNRSYNLPADTKIRVIDFGGTTDERHSKSSIVQTRHYRAPEVVLGAGWMFSADIWSVGCILLELITGKLLYDTHENREHLAMMEKSLGPMPDFLHSNASEEAQKKYFKQGKIDQSWLQGTEAEAVKSASKLKRLRKLTDTVGDLDGDLLDMLQKCLDYDRTKRMRAHDLMYCPFVVKGYADAKKKNEEREQYEIASFGHVLGKEGGKSRVEDPPYK